MSEYQYYEFRAIDHPLTAEQQAAVSALSSRAYVTAHVASFVYNYGDFRGDPEQLMSDVFDAMVYMTNWGSRRLMFRIPHTLIDTKQVGRYCISEAIDRRTTKDKAHVIIDFDFSDEDQGGWTEGEGWLDNLIDLREELIQGDYRVLYLAWLKAAEHALMAEDIDAETLEPPIPEGLGQLSPALETFAEFLNIDAELLAVAAQNSKKSQPVSLQLETWIDKLSEAERHDFLVRLSRGEKNLSILLNRRLHQLASAAQSPAVEAPPEPRSISALLETAEAWRQQKKEAERRKAELARQRELEALARREHLVWKEVETLIEEKTSASYDRAVRHLEDLHDLAKYQEDLAAFGARIAHIEQTYAKRPALLRRIRQSRRISS